MPLHVPSLAKKLQCLYQRHESVSTHEHLAAHLGIAPNNISTWINGNELRARDLVPNRHIKRIMDLFKIDTQWLELESLEEFKALLCPSLTGPWHNLLGQAVTSDAINFVRIEPRLEPMALTRGLVADNDEEGLEQFYLGDRRYISITLDDEWNDEAQRGRPTPWCSVWIALRPRVFVPLRWHRSHGLAPRRWSCHKKRRIEP